MNKITGLILAASLLIAVGCTAILETLEAPDSEPAPPPGEGTATARETCLTGRQAASGPVPKGRDPARGFAHPPGKPTPGVDETAGNLLGTLGTYLGLPLLGAAGALVQRIKPARRAKRLAANLIASVQAGRAELAGHAADALKRFDQTVTAAQTAATAAAVRCLKDKAGMNHVTPEQPTTTTRETASGP